MIVIWIHLIFALIKKIKYKSFGDIKWKKKWRKKKKKRVLVKRPSNLLVGVCSIRPAAVLLRILKYWFRLFSQLNFASWYRIHRVIYCNLLFHFPFMYKLLQQFSRLMQPLLFFYFHFIYYKMRMYLLFHLLIKNL